MRRITCLLVYFYATIFPKGQTCNRWPVVKRTDRNATYSFFRHDKPVKFDDTRERYSWEPIARKYSQQARFSKNFRVRDPSSPDKLQMLARRLDILRHRDSPVVYGRSFDRTPPGTRGTYSFRLGWASVARIERRSGRSGTSRTVVHSLGRASDFRGHQSLSQLLRFGARPLDRLRSDRQRPFVPLVLKGSTVGTTTYSRIKLTCLTTV